jgi:hypothetical protein
MKKASPGVGDECVLKFLSASSEISPQIRDGQSTSQGIDHTDEFYTQEAK